MFYGLLNRVTELCHPKTAMLGYKKDARPSDCVPVFRIQGAWTSLSLLAKRTTSAAEEMHEQSVKQRVFNGPNPTEWIESLVGRYGALLRASRTISGYRELAALFRALAG
jgi:hypothetical protein